MQTKQNFLAIKTIMSVLFLYLTTTVQASSPLWTFEALTTTTLAVPANSKANVQYRVTNQSSKTRTLRMQPIAGITQITNESGNCGATFVLPSKQACILSLQIEGSQLTAPIHEGPVVCREGMMTQCYQPNPANALQITQAPPILDAVLTLTGSPLTLSVNGVSGQFIIHNTSFEVAATNITASFEGTALENHILETENTCSYVPPNASCTLTYLPGDTIIPATSFTIQGTNTNALSAEIEIKSGSTLTQITPSTGTAAGGVGVTVTGTGLIGATEITFGGIAATDLHVINSSSVTAVTPPHAEGAVDVVIHTPAGGATLLNGYTYTAVTFGQTTGGGVIACLDSKNSLQNLIAAHTDHRTSVEWGGFGRVTDVENETDGKNNTAAIVQALENNDNTPYAAKICHDYTIDSQGNTPCQVGNRCYNDWFLPSKEQLRCLYTNHLSIGGFINALYWTSTEFSGVTAIGAWLQSFETGVQFGDRKDFSHRVRCVRQF